MLRGVTICILVALAGAALYVTKSTGAGGPGEYTLKFPDRDPKYVNPVAPSEEYACDPITEAVAYENRLDGPTANARAGAGTEHVAIRMSPDGKGISAVRPAHARLHSLSIETSGAKRTTCANSSSLTLDSCGILRSAHSSLQFFASLLRSSDGTWSLADLDPSRCGAATLSVP